ncbi:MAG: glycosyltransferase family 4 protein [Sedimentisphaerales bacterium]|nr:glycosyltransferase family 4 protein [Sedimentisphaerales bacterium]
MARSKGRLESAGEIVCCVALRDPILAHLLIPLARHPQVERIWIVRPKRLEQTALPKVRYVLVPTRWKPWRFLRMLWHCLRLGRRRQVRGFVSFNPIPYGLFSFVAAKLHRKPVHFGFIGSDWNVHVRGWLGRWLLPIIRRADFITVTGPNMRREMIERGVPADRIAVLPHGIDLDHFAVADPERARYTAIFVGNLIALKRVDLILEAFGRVAKTHPAARLCIVGDGPLAPDLKRQAQELGIAAAVDFAGYVDEVSPYLADARMIIIASEHEGLPFALIEGLCRGLVGVCTPVGTIPHLIADGENGLLFARGDAEALAQCINRLLDNEPFYRRLREASLRRRGDFTYAKASAIWEAFLGGAGHSESL